MEIAKAHYNPFVGLLPNAQQRAAKGAFSANHDDGDLNYNSGSAFSNAVKATSELHLDYGDHMGAFVRASYFYDFDNANNDKLTSLAKDQVGKRFRILDAFVYDNFDIGGHQATMRFGKQVLSWGESTFIQGGINVINPVDVSQLHVAGAELKEALLPVNMLWGSYNFTQNFSVEAHVPARIRADQSRSVGHVLLDQRFRHDRRYLRFAAVRSGAAAGEQSGELLLRYASAARPATTARSAVRAFSALRPIRWRPAGNLVRADRASLPRSLSRRIRSVRRRRALLAEALSNTEFGFYFLNYDSRLPLISGLAVTSHGAEQRRLLRRVSERHPSVRRELQHPARRPRHRAAGRVELSPEPAAADRRRRIAVRRSDAAQRA